MTQDNIASDLSTLIFYTHNVARALKPSIDGELAHAIHETLHFALDGEPQDYTIPYNESSASSCGAGSSNGDRQAASTSTLPVEENGDEDQYQIRPGFFETGDEERPFISYDWEQDDRTLILPHPVTVTNPTITDPCTNIEQGTGVRDAFDVTAKFFFLGETSKGEESYSAEWINEALNRFAVATGLDSVDTLILAFGELGRDAKMESKVGRIAKLWRQLSPNQQILSLGLSDFTESALRSLLDNLQLGECASTPSLHTPQVKAPKSSMTSQVQDSIAINDNAGLESKSGATHVHIPSSPSKVAFTELAIEDEESLREYGPGKCRRPRLCAINLKEQSDGVNGSNTNSKPVTSNGQSNGSCCWDRGLAEYCKESNILLVAHSDRKDILPARTLPTLMKEFDGKLPHALPKGKRLLPLWCFKYTVLIRDRGVLADKGFLLYAKVVDV